MGKSSRSKALNVKQIDTESRAEILRALNVDVKELVAESLNVFLTNGTQLLLQLLMDAEVQTLCGEMHERSDDRQYYRWGSERGSALIDGAKRAVARPRVRALRSVNGSSEEVQLETYRTMNSKELMDGPLVASILSGVSARNYQKIVARKLEAKGISKSTVSRKAIAATKPTVDEFRLKRFEEMDFVVLFFDGTYVSKRQVITCVGIDISGTKHVLAVRNGASENEIVCKDLISDLRERGLDCTKKYLFVIDGSKALAGAIRAAFGQDVAIQRCQEHKVRNVLAYLPRRMAQEVRSKMHAAYNSKTQKEAIERLDNLRNEISLVSQHAASTLAEGMYESLTVIRLKVNGQLRKSLRTTNIIESAFSSVKRYMGRVSSFQDEAQIDLWITRSLLEAETHFRMLPGNRQLKGLQNRLINYKAKNTKLSRYN